MSEIRSFFIHGFNTDDAGWIGFLGSLPIVNQVGTAAIQFLNLILPGLQAEEHVKRYIDDPAFETEMVSWDSQKLGNKVLLGLGAIFSDSAVTSVHDKWDAATEDAPLVGRALAAFINRTSRPGDRIVLTAHSLGTIAAYHAVKNLRSDLDVFLFFMAGVAECFECEYLIDDHENLKYFFNVYNSNDFALSRMLPAIDCPNSPVGTVAMTPAKQGVAFNFETGFGHSDYKDVRLRAKFVEFTYLVADYGRI